MLGVIAQLVCSCRPSPRNPQVSPVGGDRTIRTRSVVVPQPRAPVSSSQAGLPAWPSGTYRARLNVCPDVAASRTKSSRPLSSWPRTASMEMLASAGGARVGMARLCGCCASTPHGPAVSGCTCSWLSASRVCSSRKPSRTRATAVRCRPLPPGQGKPCFMLMVLEASPTLSQGGAHSRRVQRHVAVACRPSASSASATGSSVRPGNNSCNSGRGSAPETDMVAAPRRRLLQTVGGR